MKCQMCGKECNGYISLSSHISRFHKMKSKDYYDQFLKKENEGICCCGKTTNYGRMSNGYSKYCSLKCSNNSPPVKEKYIQTCKDRFGVENASQAEKIKQLKIETSRKNWNCDYPNQSEEVQKIRKQTCLERFGETTNLKCKEIQEKIKQTNLENLGVNNPFKSKAIQEQIKQTNLENLGVNNPFKSKEIQEQIRQININKFGVPNPMQSEVVKEKHKQTCIKNLGVSYPLQSESVKETHRNTCINHFGKDNWSKTPQGKKLHRINSIRMRDNQLANDEPAMPRTGIIERLFLNILQQYIKYKIIRNDSSFRYIIGRFPDGHVSELKLFIQFDEKLHFEDKEMTIYKEDDILCTQDLESIPDYTVFRISEKQWKENQEKVIFDFKQLVQKLENV